MKLKKFILSITASAVIAQPMVAPAADLDSALNNLLGPGSAAQFNAPGRFQSGARTSFSAGGMELRVPRAKNPPALFSVSMPKIEAGCNGISAHFGGFSFISGKEIEAMIKQIASGAALGFVSQLVMKTLCPPCEDVVQDLKAAAQKAAEYTKNSCEIGAKLGQDFMKGIGLSNSPVSLCSQTGAKEGAFEDSLVGYNSVCNTITSASKALREFVGAKSSTDSTATPEEKAKTAELEACTGVGNITWKQINATDEGKSEEAYYRKLTLLNLMGANFNLGEQKPEDGAMGCELTPGGAMKMPTEGATNIFCVPPINTKTLISYYMCGSPAAYESYKSKLPQSIQRYCETENMGTAAEPVDNKLYVCDGDDKEFCNKLKLVTPDQFVRGQGFLMRVHSLLMNAVLRVQGNIPWSETLDGISGEEVMKLIQATPYPLYQAINVAAVYPAAATDVLDSLSVLIAEQIAYATLDETLRIEGRTPSGQCVTEGQIGRLVDFVDGLRTTNIARKRALLDNFATQEAISASIKQLNQAIQRQVMSPEMLSSSRSAEKFNDAVSKSIQQ